MATGDDGSYAVDRVMFEVPGPHFIKVVICNKVHDASIEHRVSSLDANVNFVDGLQVVHPVVGLHQILEDESATGRTSNHSGTQHDGQVRVPSWLRV